MKLAQLQFRQGSEEKKRELAQTMSSKETQRRIMRVDVPEQIAEYQEILAEGLQGPGRHARYLRPAMPARRWGPNILRPERAAARGARGRTSSVLGTEQTGV